jgi:sarcosine oxidase
MTRLRVVVVGGGVIGLLTAMNCARAGALVEVLDRAEIPAPTATSHDTHRVVRALHRGDRALTMAAGPAHRAWRDVERQVGGHFYHRVGVLTAVTAHDLDGHLALLGEAGVPARALSAKEVAKRYPAVLLPTGAHAIFEPAAGAILADQALQAMGSWLENQPGVSLLPHHRVIGIGSSGARSESTTVSVHLADGSALTRDRVVVAAGPWSRQLLPASLAAGLTLYRQTMLSYAARGRGWAGMPAVLGLGRRSDAWLMPPVAGRPARLSAASACRIVGAVTDRASPRLWRDHLTDLFSGVLPDFQPERVTGATDGYYLSEGPDGRPLLADLGDGRVWAYAACGGMSFKFAPLIARAITDHALGRHLQPTGLAWADSPRQLMAHWSVGEPVAAA